MASPLCSFSRDLSLFATIGADNRIKIWNTKTGKLKQQLAQPSHLNVSYTCLSWSPVIKVQAKSKKKGNNQSSVFKSFLATGTQNGEIICWNINKGTVEKTLTHTTSSNNSSSGKTSVTDVCFNEDASVIYSSGEDACVLQWNFNSGEIMHKFKAGKRPIHKISVSGNNDNNTSTSYLATASSAFIKLWDISSSSVSTKFPGFTSGKVNSLSITANNNFILSSGLNERFLNLWPLSSDSLTSNNNVSPITFVCSSPPTNTNISTFNSNIANKSKKKKNKQASDTQPTEMHVLAVLPKSLNVWKYSQNSTATKALKPISTISLPNAIANDKSDVILDAAFASKNSIIIASGSLVRPQFECIEYMDSANKFIKQLMLADKAANLLIKEKSEQKSQQTVTETEVLPAADVHKMPTPKLPTQQKRKIITLREQLEALETNNVTANGHVKKTDKMKRSQLPTSGSLSSALAQALQSGDKQLLESCLSVGNKSIIRQTAKKLPPKHVIQFLKVVVERFQASPNRGYHLTLWIKAILESHTSYLMNVPNLQDSTTLAGFHQTIEARLESYTQLMNLSGRLDLVLTQIKAREEAATNKSNAKVFTEDDLESDDEDDDEDESDEDINSDDEDDEDDDSEEDEELESDDDDDDDDDDEEEEEGEFESEEESEDDENDGDDDDE